MYFHHLEMYSIRPHFPSCFYRYLQQTIKVIYHPLILLDLEFYFDGIYQKYLPIYYDGSVHIMNDKGVMTKGKELFEFANKHKLAIAKIEDLISYRLKNEKLVKLKKTDKIVIKNKKYQIKIFENQLDGSEHFALIKGKISPTKNTRVRVISSNLVESYLLGKRLPNSFNNTLDYFKDYNNCVLVFIRDSNLKSVSSTLIDFKSDKKNNLGTDKLIRNYGIGAQIIKALKVKNMILVTRSPKKVIGLEGFGIKIIKQEIIK